MESRTEQLLTVVHSESNEIRTYIMQLNNSYYTTR